MASCVKFIAPLLMLLFGAGCTDEGPGRAPNRAPELADADFARGADLAQPVEAFSYSTGLTGETLLLAADGAYRRMAWGCASSSWHEGRFYREKEEVVLEPALRESSPSAHLALRFRLVRWGERHYLIQDAWWLMFCNAVNAGEEPATGSWSTFFLREGDLTRPAEGLPDIPEPWRSRLLLTPIAAHAIEMLEGGDAWIDAGSADGVFEGMQLWLPELPLAPEIQHLYGGATTIEPVEVVAVEERRCRVHIFIHPGWTVQTGLLVSSRDPRAR